jgi:hypothetical protein
MVRMNDARKTALGAIAIACVLAAAAAANQSALSISLTTKPSPVLLGQNRFEVTVKTSAGRPVSGADVSVLMVMPAMPEIKHPEMKSDFSLKSAGGGKYTGIGMVTMAGKWNVIITVRRAGKEIGRKKLTLATK